MFNLQGSEIVIVLLLALVVLGPEKLPDAMRRLGQFYAEMKKMSSGFQSEFRAAIDEPMREVRDTASVLRDSADLTKLQDGDRDEKPKSAEMGPVADPDALPAASVSGFDRPAPAGTPDEPGLAADSKPAPFAGVSSAAPRTLPADVDASTVGDDSDPDVAAGDAPEEKVSAADSKSAPFAGVSSAAQRPPTADGPSQSDGPAETDDAASADNDGTGADAEQSPGVDDATGRAR